MSSSCTLFGFNLATCLTSTVGGWISSWSAALPWWAWVLGALIVIGVAYKMAGWFGIVALALGVGYGARAIQDGEHAPKPVPPRSTQPDPPSSRFPYLW